MNILYEMSTSLLWTVKHSSKQDYEMQPCDDDTPVKDARKTSHFSSYMHPWKFLLVKRGASKSKKAKEPQGIFMVRLLKLVFHPPSHCETEAKALCDFYQRTYVWIPALKTLHEPCRAFSLQLAGENGLRKVSIKPNVLIKKKKKKCQSLNCRQ